MLSRDQALPTCGITQETPVDPVIDPCGHVFEKAAITAWIKKKSKSPAKCPINPKQTLTLGQLIPARDLQKVMAYTSQLEDELKAANTLLARKFTKEEELPYTLSETEVCLRELKHLHAQATADQQTIRMLTIQKIVAVKAITEVDAKIQALYPRTKEQILEARKEFVRKQTKSIKAINKNMAAVNSEALETNLAAIEKLNQSTAILKQHARKHNETVTTLKTELQVELYPLLERRKRYATFWQECEDKSNEISQNLVLLKQAQGALAARLPQLHFSSTAATFKKLGGTKESGNKLTPEMLNTNFINAVKTGKVKLARRWLKKGADVNCTLQDTDPALHIACSRVDIEMVQLLLKHKANPDILTKNQETPLISLAKSPIQNADSILILHALNVADANINATDKLGNTALHWSMRQGNADVAEELLDAECDVTIQNHANERAHEQIQPDESQNTDRMSTIKDRIMKELKPAEPETPSCFARILRQLRY